MKVDFLHTHVELAARQVTAPGGILILLDSNGDCPKDLATQLRKEASAVRGDVEISVVLAKQEFEAWFIAAAVSLRGKNGLIDTAVTPPDFEEISDAKGWIRRHMVNGRYQETVDQERLTSRFNLEQARASRSFTKFYRDVSLLLEHVE